MSFQRNVGAADNEFGIVFTERVDEAFQTVLVASAMIFCWGAVVRLDIDFGRPVTQVGIEKNLLPVAENFSGGAENRCPAVAVFGTPPWRRLQTPY